MLKKILAILVMIFSVLGAVLCAAGVIGAWVAQSPARNAAHSAFDTADGYVTLARQATQNVSERIAGVRTEIEDTQARLQSVTPEQRDAMRQQLLAAVQQRFLPSVVAVRTTVKQVSAGAVALNQTLESVNRLPGVNAPTFTDQLAAIDQRLDLLNSQLETYQAALSDTDFNGERLSAAATQVTDEIKGVEGVLAEWQGRIENLDTRLKSTRGQIDTILPLSAVALTLFLGLFLAGQISLFTHALGWFRGRKAN